MVEIKEINYVRKVTHTEYTFMRDAAKKVGILNKVDKVLTDNKWIVDKTNFEKRTGFDPDRIVIIWFLPSFYKCGIFFIKFYKLIDL